MFNSSSTTVNDATRTANETPGGLDNGGGQPGATKGAGTVDTTSSSAFAAKITGMAAGAGLGLGLGLGFVGVVLL